MKVSCPKFAPLNFYLRWLIIASAQRDQEEHYHPHSKLPPYRASVFVLGSEGLDGRQRLLGTCVAVSGQHLLTAGHCVLKTNSDDQKWIIGNLWCCTGGVDTEDNTRNYSRHGEVIPVVVISAALSPDLAVLRRTDDGEFPHPIPICPKSQLPWQTNPSLWEARGKLYYCPVEAFLYRNEPMVGAETTEEYLSIASVMHPRLRIRYSVFSDAFISRGGAVVLQSNNKLVGIITSVTSATTVDLENCALVSADNESDTLATTVSIPLRDIPNCKDDLIRLISLKFQFWRKVCVRR